MPPPASRRPSSRPQRSRLSLMRCQRSSHLHLPSPLPPHRRPTRLPSAHFQRSSIPSARSGQAILDHLVDSEGPQTVAQFIAARAGRVAALQAWHDQVGRKDLSMILGVSEGTLRREHPAAHPPVPVPAPAPAPGPTPVGSSVPGPGSSCDLGNIRQNSPHIRAVPKMIDSSIKESSFDSATFLPSG
jgi:hypothetical protein